MTKFEQHTSNIKKKTSKEGELESNPIKNKLLNDKTEARGYKLNEVMYDEYKGPLSDEPTQLNG